MRLTIFAKGLLSLETLLMLLSLAVAVPTPAQTVDADYDSPYAFTSWMKQYEEDHPGSKVGPYVGSLDKYGVPADQGRFDIDGNFNLSGIPTESLHLVELNCNGNCKPFAKKRYVDTRRPKKEHSCVRWTLAAMAHYRLFCMQKDPLDNVGCWWAHPPSIDHCCGEWIESDSVEAKTAWPMMKKHREKINKLEYFVFSPISEKRKNKAGKKVMMDRVIGKSTQDFKMNVLGCPNWRTRDDWEYAYFTDHLEAWGIFDADATGKVLGLGYNWYEPIVPQLSIRSREPQAWNKDYRNRTAGEI